MRLCFLQAISVSIMVISILATGRSPQRRSRKRSYKSKRGQSQSDAYQQYLKRYKSYKRMYYEQFNPEKVKGRCAYSKNWKLNGSNPIYENSRNGYITVLYLINTKCRYCINELKSLHIWAEYFKKIDKKVAIVAINQRYTRQSPYVIDQFPLIKIHQEPSNTNIFKKLRGKAGDILIYDRCGRQLYYFGHPYSSLVQPFVRLAMQNTEYHYKTMCGECNKRKRTKKPLITSTMVPKTQKRPTKPKTENQVIHKAANVPKAIEINITKVASTFNPLTTKQTTTTRNTSRSLISTLQPTKNTRTVTPTIKATKNPTITKEMGKKHYKIYKSTHNPLKNLNFNTTPTKSFAKSTISPLLTKRTNKTLKITPEGQIRLNRNAISKRVNAFNTQTSTSPASTLGTVDGKGSSTDSYTTESLYSTESSSTDLPMTTDSDIVETTEPTMTTYTTDAGHLMIWNIDGPFN